MIILRIESQNIHMQFPNESEEAYEILIIVLEWAKERVKKREANKNEKV